MAESKSEAVSGAHSIAPAWSDVTALGPASFRIRLGGTFTPAWLARLCRGLASQRISIDRAHAMRAPNRAWSAELHVVSLPGAPALGSLPILPLIAADVPDPGALELDSYELTPSTAHGGTLHLAIDAPDSLGLLGALLAQLAKLTLYPIEMHIETQAGRAQDSLWLYTDQSSRRVTELQDLVERMLASALRTQGR